METAIRFCIDHPKLVNLTMVVISLLGIISFESARYEVTPSIEMGVVNITTTKPGAGPEEIELSVTMVLEEELLKVAGVKKVYSRSMENLSLITLHLDQNIKDQNKVLNKIQQAVDRAQSHLPNDLLEKPVIEELGSNNLAAVELHIRGKVSENLLRDMARVLEKKLRTLPGIAGVDIEGYRKPEVELQVNPNKQQQLGLSLDEIRQALAYRNVRDSGGAVMSVSSEKKVLAVGLLDDPLDVSDVVIRSRGPGNEVLVRDVATVLPGYEPWRTQVISNGELAIKLRIKKKPDVDLIKVTNLIRAFIEKEQHVAPAGVVIEITSETSTVTSSMLDTLISNAGLGLISVFVILTLFFGRHLAFWVSLGLPFSVLACFYFLTFTPHTINTFTLMAMVLMLGMLVDDAIVTAECIQRFRELGYEPREAAIRGTVAVGSPVLVSVLTTMLAFVPLFFLGGIEGQYISVFPLVVVMMLGASLFQSKFILPNHLSFANMRIKSPQWMKRSANRYENLLRKLLEHRFRSLAILTSGFILLMVISASFIRFELHPETALGTMYVQTELPIGTPFDNNVEKIKALQQDFIARLHPGDLDNISTVVGHHDTDPYGGSLGLNQAWAVTKIKFNHRNDMHTSHNEAATLVKEIVAGQKGFSMIYASSSGGGPVLGKAAELEIMSEDSSRFAVAEDMKDFLRNQPGVLRAWDSRSMGKSALDLQFDYDKLAAYGLTVKQVSDAIKVAMDGLIIGEQQTAVERIYYRLKMQHENEPTMNELRDMFIINQRGEPVALRSVANFVMRPGDTDIKHYAGRRTVTVYADIDREITDVGTINNQLRNYVRDYQRTHTIPEISFYQGGEIEQQEQSMGDPSIAFITCLLLSFFILVVLFNSYSQPLIVLAVLPFGIVGVMVAFSVQGLPLSFLSLVGLLGLVGVLLNNSVVMVHTLNTGKREVDDEAIIRRAVTRFRPIVITSLTTLVGLVPAAYGIGGEEPLVTPMVMAMVWGVLFGTLVSLLMLPCIFAINQDLRRRLSDAWASRKTATAKSSQ